MVPKHYQLVTAMTNKELAENLRPCSGKDGDFLGDLSQHQSREHHFT